MTLSKRFFSTATKQSVEAPALTEKRKLRKAVNDWIATEGVKFKYPDGSGQPNFVVKSDKTV
jgi:hypothetical protein